eukprot:TCONS_00012681-protein
MKMDPTKNKTFQLQGQSGGFSDRLNSIFGSLDEKQSINEDSNKIINSKNNDERISTENKEKRAHREYHQADSRNEKQEFSKPGERSHHRESRELYKPPKRCPRDNNEFQKPYDRPQRGRRNARVPDHVLHPEKYQKYSLKQDGTRDSKLKGDALNKKIALDFIDSLRGEKDLENEDFNRDKGVDFKPKFRQSSSKTNNDDNKINSKRPTFQSSHGAKARVMETFEFGKSSTFSKSKQKEIEISEKEPSSSKPTKSEDKVSTGGGITLNYYEDEEEDET